MDRLLAAGDGIVRRVTLAPELSGAPAAIDALRDAGITVAIGHTDVDAAGARDAFHAGARVVTHLFNAMRPLHHRSAGPIGAALTDPRVAVEIIADGVHLDDDVVLLASRAATGRFLLVTDAMAAAGASDGAYRLGGLDVTVCDSVARLTTTGAIAGSTLTMDAAVGGAVRAGIELDAAFVAATHTPAERLGFADRGILALGPRADLVTLDAALSVRDVLFGGQWAP